MRVFITGITGSLGTALARLHAGRGDQVFGCSRSEARAVEWLKEHGRLATHLLCYAAALADRRSDAGRLLPSMDRVYHCAAMKHVDLCERQPREALQENVMAADAVAHVCDETGVPLVFVSTDKACLPTGVYGLTKALAEKVALRHGAAVVRLGNLIGSSGSVFAAWRDAVREGRPVTLTDPLMTRFFMTVEQAARFTADQHSAGAVAVPQLLAACMGEVAVAVTGPHDPAAVIGPRPGETRHQWLLAPGDVVQIDQSRYLLDGLGSPLPAGLSSETAERWDTAELLAAAGVNV